MEEIRNAALAYYKTGSEEFKHMAHDFFRRLRLSHHSDGCVSISQLDQFFKERGYEPFRPSLLKELGKEPTDYLDFTEAFALYYVVVTRRSYCDVCEAFLKGLYFTCMNCFHHEDKTYNLCNDCFGKGKGCPHGHGQVALLDNFTALQAKSKAAENQFKLKRNIMDLHVPLEMGGAKLITSGAKLSPEKLQLHNLFHKMEFTYLKDKGSHPHGRIRLVNNGTLQGNVTDNSSHACSYG